MFFKIQNPILDCPLTHPITLREVAGFEGVRSVLRITLGVVLFFTLFFGFIFMTADLEKQIFGSRIGSWFSMFLFIFIFVAIFFVLRFILKTLIPWKKTLGMIRLFPDGRCEVSQYEPEHTKGSTPKTPPRILKNRKYLEKMTSGLFNDWIYEPDSNLETWFQNWEPQIKKLVQEKIRRTHAKIKVEPTGAILLRFSYSEVADEAQEHIYVRIFTI